MCPLYKGSLLSTYSSIIIFCGVLKKLYIYLLQCWDKHRSFSLLSKFTTTVVQSQPVYFLINSSLTGAKWCLMLLFCFSLMICDVEYIFIYMFAICISSLEKCLLSTFYSFIKLDICYWILGVPHIRSILDAKPPSDIWWANVSSRSVGCLFILWNVSLHVQKLLVWYNPTCLVLFCCLWFWCHVVISFDLSLVLVIYTLSFSFVLCLASPLSILLVFFFK